MTTDTQDAIRVVQNKSAESEAYQRQLHIWLGAGSAGGAVAMVSLAANLPDPANVFRFLQPSLWSFLIGVCGAGTSIFFLSQRAAAMGEHVATAHNHDQLSEKIKTIPEMISSPPRIADEANRGRKRLIERSNREQERAERAWMVQQRYQIAWAVSLAVSAASFVFGFAWPLVQVSFFGGSLLP